MKNCTIEGCDKATKARGMCNMHYLRQWKHGDTAEVKQVGSKPQDMPAYNALHKRINYHRGPAKNRTCACGAQARDWAYDHTDQNPLIGSNGKEDMVYSTDINRYVAMCRPCHLEFDGKVSR